MKKLIVFLAALILAAVPVLSLAEVDSYPLRWGMTTDEVKAVVGKDLYYPKEYTDPVHGKVNLYNYSNRKVGEFTGSVLSLFFYNNSLSFKTYQLLDNTKGDKQASLQRDLEKEYGKGGMDFKMLSPVIESLLETAIPEADLRALTLAGNIRFATWKTENDNIVVVNLNAGDGSRTFLVYYPD